MVIILLIILACNFPQVSEISSFFEPETEHSLPPSRQPINGPEVSFQTPISAIQLSKGEITPVRVSARDERGITRIDLWVDDVLVLSAKAPKDQPEGITPMILNYDMIAVETGMYSLVARAYNSLGILGESLAVHVSVSNEELADPDPGPVHYIAVEGDTIQSIGDDTGNTPDEIKKANPGIVDNPKPDQLIALPKVPSEEPPAQPALPILDGGIPQIGFLPIMPPGGQLLPEVQPDEDQITLDIFPEFKAEVNLLNPQLKTPDSLKASAADCKVTLSWNDNAEGEIGYAIYRRLIPDQVSPQFVASVPQDQTSYIDQVPFPGIYQYFVEAQGEPDKIKPDKNIGNLPDNAIATNRSTPFAINMKPSGSCIPDPEQTKFLHLQPIYFSFINTSGGFAALWYSINDSPGRRIPSNQGQYDPAGNWQVKDEVTPITGTTYLNPDQDIITKFWAAAYTLQDWAGSGGPTDVGEAYKAHIAEDIGEKDDRYYVAQNNLFKVQYKLWLENVRWTGKGTNPSIPAPKNLRIQRTTSTSRVLTWDWSGSTNKIDGFILYRSYSCPGMDAKIYAPKIILASQSTSEIELLSEPLGCVYKYELSAYGRQGESSRSNALEGSTESNFAMANLVFKYLVINDIPYRPGGVRIDLYANDFHKRSQKYFLKEATYSLGNLIFDGRQPNNTIGLSLGEKEHLTLSFSISEIDDQGFVSKGSICKGAALVLPVKVWKEDSWELIMKSSDGSCEIIVGLNGVESTSTPSGEIVFPQADITVTDIKHIGFQTFARIQNFGPEPLPANQIAYRASFGTMDKNGEFTITSPWYGVKTLNVQSSLPQWISLGEYIDQTYYYTCRNNPSNCNFAIQVEIWSDGLKDKDKKPNFHDPNPANNILRMEGRNIQPME